MTAVSQPSPATTPPSPEGIKDSLASVISELSNKPVTSGELNDQKISEDVLFAAQVHSSLKETDPELASKMLSQLKGLHTKKQNRKLSQPLFRAVDSFLQRAVNKKQINKRQKNTLIREAFGMAQLDAKTTLLGRKPKTIEPTDKAQTSNVDRVLSHSQTNTAASRKEMRDFRQRINARGTLSDKRIKQTENLFDRIFPETKTPPASQDSASSSEPLDYNSIETGPNEMVYRPEGTNGGVQFFLPELYTDQVADVELISEEGSKSIPLTHKTLGKDNRRIFESATPGNTLEGNIFVRLFFVDGTQSDQPVGDASSFARHSYDSA